MKMKPSYSRLCDRVRLGGGRFRLLLLYACVHFNSEYV